MDISHKTVLQHDPIFWMPTIGNISTRKCIIWWFLATKTAPEETDLDTSSCSKQEDYNTK